MDRDVEGNLLLPGAAEDGDTAKAVEQKMKSCVDDITGGFIWFFHDSKKLGKPNTTADYADAINSVNPEKDK